MSDQFKNDIERIQKLIVSIKQDMNKREQKQKGGQQLTMIEGEIRGQLASLGNAFRKTLIDRELVLIADVLKYQENNQMQKENEKRKNQIQELKNQRDLIKEQFNKSVADTKQEVAMQNLQRDDAKLAVMNNQELYKNQKDLQLQQDKLLDRTNDQADQLKQQGKQINLTLDEQNKQLDKLNIDVDKTNQQMMTTNNKLVKLIAKSSNCGLLIFIVIEVVIFGVLLWWALT
ncbi:unnamed protein product (macronuclear) [Paramecium tetraurelia]|uniref:t-SNARE coiled-coil homology domain-containing protein n=1 Tax=Paramecium tetraurelia TaxID=5888 RepID=A0D8P5_PARTE|nr:uncharacterized protein GSPATT00014358001 [Paramecium tetraurelia]CAK79412.1 unnamed protein product [Paramecium tetraurelia]|eukprot:XP_001446809.1 hypothetical protein (macronuclear) [Paramecium tetraurelia strain d4-2]